TPHTTHTRAHTHTPHMLSHTHTPHTTHAHTHTPHMLTHTPHMLTHTHTTHAHTHTLTMAHSKSKSQIGLTLADMSAALSPSVPHYGNVARHRIGHRCLSLFRSFTLSLSLSLSFSAVLVPGRA